MSWFMAYALILVSIIGGVSWFLWRSEPRPRLQFAWRIAVIGVLGLCVAWGGTRWAQSARLKFTQNLHGNEIRATADTTQCHRDGSCRYEYNCDPYIVMVPYQSCSTDSKGRQSCTTQYRSETRYHACPYTNYEVTYGVTTTLGEYGIGTTLPKNPNAERWRRGTRVPTGYPAGDPQRWVAAYRRQLAGRPGPVARASTYDNYVLASEYTVLRRWSDRVRRLDSLKALAPLLTTVEGEYDLQRLSVAPGLTVANRAEWNRRIGIVNALLGPARQGSLIVVVVPAVKGISAENHTTALQAFWQDEERQGRTALPKNLIAIVLGVEQNRVAWSRAFTGMPEGNDALKSVARTKFVGVPVDIDSLIGVPVLTPRGGMVADSILRETDRSEVLQNSKYVMAIGTGAIPRLVFGIDDSQTGFQRTSMTGKSGRGRGYTYLKEEIQPSSAGWWTLTILTPIILVAAWLCLWSEALRNAAGGDAVTWSRSSSLGRR